MKPGSFILIFVLAFASCTVPGSLHPLTKNDSQSIYNPALVGQWQEENSPDEKYIFTRGDDTEDKFYNCIIISTDYNKKDTTYFVARLIKLNNLSFLDCWYDLKKAKNTEMEYYTIPRHYFFRVNIINNDSVELAFPDVDEIHALVKEGKINMKITNLNSLDVSDDYLITSETPELQKAFIDLEKYASSVYKDTSTFTRIH